MAYGDLDPNAKWGVQHGQEMYDEHGNRTYSGGGGANTGDADTDRAANYVNDVSYRQRTYAPGHYGGYLAGQNEARGRYQGLATAAAGRTAPTINDPYGAQNRGFQNDSRGLELASRGNQSDALALARNAAYGNAPSAAAVQQGAGVDASINAQLAAANSARGGVQNFAAAQHGAATQAGQLQAQAVNQGALLRAQEMAQAREQFGSISAQQRQQDFSRRAQDLQLMGLDQDMATKQAALEMQQRDMNQQGQMGYEKMAQGVDTDALRADFEQQRLMQDRAMGKDKTSEGVMGGIGTAAGIAAMMFSDIRAKQNVSPAGTMQSQYSQQAQGLQAAQGYDAAHGQPGGFTAQGQPIAGSSNPYDRSYGLNANLQTGSPSPAPTTGLAMAARQMSDPASVQPAAMSQPAAAPPAQPMALSAMQPTVSPASQMVSDERAKNVHGSEASKFMDQLHPYTYEYKDPRHGEGRYLGVMAQDVAKSNVGQHMVGQDHDGTLYLKGDKMVSATLAGLADVHQRMRKAGI